jgi:nicotinamide riboside kinase
MKFAFTGPESTGKTTVSQEVARITSDSIWHPELARLYLESTNSSRLTLQEFKKICEKSSQLFSNPTNSTAIFDTDMYVLSLWNKKEFNIHISNVDYCCSIPFDHHFLCKPDFPWVSDPLRYGGTEEARLQLFEEYVEILEHYKAPYTILEGSLTTRVTLACEVINGLLKK